VPPFSLTSAGLLLRTLPQIDSDRAAGIIDPSKPKPISVSLSDGHADTGTTKDSDVDPHEGAVVDSNPDSETAIETEAEAHLDTTNTGDPPHS
jgi:hypothetical protein